MQILPTKITDVIIIEPRVHRDDRGYFAEIFRETVLNCRFVQENEALSRKNVLRGLHFQAPPYAQAKLISVVDGRILDVALDLRPDSPTFGQHVAHILDSDDKRRMLVPKGFAHGYLVLSEQAIIQYKVDEYWHPETEGGIAFDDPALGIDWGISREEAILSPKDTGLPTFEEWRKSLG